MVLEPESPVRKVWKPELYQIQLGAPTPNPMQRKKELENAPIQYGYEFHGIMGHLEAVKLLNETNDGTYLLRQGSSANDFYTLSVKFNDRVHHYKLYYNHGKHFVNARDKMYDSVQELIADGLITMHMELHAAQVIQAMHTRSNYQESPYMTLNRRKLKALRESQKLSSINSENVDGINNLRIQQQESVGPSNPVVVRYTKHHAFKIHTFKGLNWCEFCGNFLWGFTAQGVKCEDCGFMAHSKCSEQVPSDCRPDLKRIRGVFGTDLTTLLTARSEALPFPVTRCVTEIEKRGLDQEGIYRVSGFQDEIDALKSALDTDEESSDLSEHNINVVAGTLKLYLRLLPVPLVTFDAHPALVAATQLKTVEEQIAVIRIALGRLPPAHFNTLKYMIEHLNKVSQRCLINKMTAHNLSTVFAPTLIAITTQVTNLTQEIFMLELLITQYAKIFA